MLSHDAALVVDRKLRLTIWVWAAEFLSLHFLSQLLVRGLQKSFLGHGGAVGKVNLICTHLNILWLGRAVI